VACFDEPIREHLHLHLAPGALVAVWSHDIAEPGRAQGNPAVRQRMEESRDAVERGYVPAAQWFDRVASAASRYEIERVEGTVRHARWSAVVTDPREATDLLADTGWTAVVESRGDGVELYLEPAGSPRATRAERQLADEYLETWSTEVAAYLAATIDLYDYLDGRPDRAVACFAHIFEDDDVNRAWPLDDHEESLLVAVSDAVDAVGAVLFVPDGQAYSPNELSRLVFDPFPARLTISSADGTPVGAGLDAKDGYLERPPISLWQALTDLEGLWLAPDVVTALAAPADLDAQPEVDAAEFAARPRQFTSAPSASEVEAAVRSRLVRDDDIVVRANVPWSPDDEPADPGGLLAAVTAAVPGP
jgi:hypothetical protein